MDRFIGMDENMGICVELFLKSNMDRFIDSRYFT